MSILKNELYKITIKLKEVAENSQKDNTEQGICLAFFIFYKNIKNKKRKNQSVTENINILINLPD